MITATLRHTITVLNATQIGVKTGRSLGGGVGAFADPWETGEKAPRAIDDPIQDYLDRVPDPADNEDVDDQDL